MTNKRGIGWIEYWCDRARRDALRGVKARREDIPKSKRGYYLNAWRRETARMRTLGKLPQLELALQVCNVSDAESPCAGGGD